MKKKCRWCRCEYEAITARSNYCLGCRAVVSNEAKKRQLSVNKKCLFCGERIPKNNIKFCSIICRDRYLSDKEKTEKKYYTCEQCGNRFTSKWKRKTCSESCLEKLRLAKKRGSVKKIDEKFLRGASFEDRIKHCLRRGIWH